MDWNQIESKWAAMTARVRGDVLAVKADFPARAEPRPASPGPDSTGAEAPAGERGDARSVMSVE